MSRLQVTEVKYIDFTEDGEDEAFVNLREFGGSGSSYCNQHYYIYTMRNKRPYLLWKLSTGSKAIGGLKDFRLKNKEFIIELYGKCKIVGTELKVNEGEEFTSECCHKEYTVFRFGWNGHKLVQKEVNVLDFSYRSIGDEPKQ